MLYGHHIEELSRRIYQPRTPTLRVSVRYQPTDWPRLWLMSGDETGAEGVDTLHVTLPRETFFAGPWPQTALPLPRPGTWKRYRADLAWAAAVVRSRGWTLSEDERALTHALDEHGRRPWTWVAARLHRSWKLAGCLRWRRRTQGDGR